MENIKLFFKIALPLCSLLLGACTTRVPLNESYRSSIKQSQQILATKQKNIEIKDLDTVYAPTGGGVAGAVIGVALVSAINKNENNKHSKVLMPVTKNFKEGYFNQLMSQHLNRELSSIKWLHLIESSITNEKLDVSEQLAKANQLPNQSDTLIYVDFSYQLDPIALNKLKMVARVSIYKKETPRHLVIYSNTFEYIDALKKRKYQNYIELWAQNNGQLMEESMRNGIQILTQLIAKDIQNSKILPNKKRPTNVWYENFGSDANTGYFVKEKNNKTVVRNSAGEVIVLSSNLVQQKHNWRE